jgi:curli biogenesis system outer membrane secretion channel CsgG
VKNISSVGACIVLFMMSVCSQDQKEYIAVMDLEGRGVSTFEAQTLTDKLRGELINTGKFTVVERGKMEDILKEQGFQQTGCTSEECIVEMGQLIGVSQMIAGSIGKVGSTFLVSIRLIIPFIFTTIPHPPPSTITMFVCYFFFI